MSLSVQRMEAILKQEYNVLFIELFGQQINHQQLNNELWEAVSTKYAKKLSRLTRLKVRIQQLCCFSVIQQESCELQGKWIYCVNETVSSCVFDSNDDALDSACDALGASLPPAIFVEQIGAKFHLLSETNPNEVYDDRDLAYRS